jgi:epoxyqueuosine reductase
MDRAESFGDEQLRAWSSRAEELGLLQLGAVNLDHPGFVPARKRLAEFLDGEREGEMAFLSRTREVRMHPEQMLEGAQSVLVAVVPYRGVASPVARYAQAADYHTILHERLLELAGAIEADLPGTESLVCVDTKPLLERSAAVLAGLGFLGKNGCLIVPKLGSYVLIASLMLTARFEGEDRAPAWAAREGGGSPPTLPWQACGTCTRCIEACPSEAFEEVGQLDARRCISYLTIEHRGPIEEDLREAIGERIAGCDLCQEVCPYNAAPGREDRVPDAAWLPPPPGRERVADLPRLANVGNNQHRAFVKKTALNRIPRNALRRNAIIALGNGEGAISRLEQESLERACEDADLGSLARWALARRGA